MWAFIVAEILVAVAGAEFVVHARAAQVKAGALDDPFRRADERRGRLDSGHAGGVAAGLRQTGVSGAKVEAVAALGAEGRRAVGVGGRETRRRAIHLDHDGAVHLDPQDMSAPLQHLTASLGARVR